MNSYLNFCFLVALATFQVCNSHTWLMAPVLDSTGLEQGLSNCFYKGPESILGFANHITPGLQNLAWGIKEVFKRVTFKLGFKE